MIARRPPAVVLEQRRPALDWKAKVGRAFRRDHPHTLSFGAL